MSMSILQAALSFFADKMTKFLSILTVDITTYKGGVIWSVIGTIYDAILAMGVTIAGVLIWFGLFSSTSRYAELKKATVWGQFLVEIVITNAVLYYGKFLLLNVVNIGQGMARKLLSVTGMVVTTPELELPGGATIPSFEVMDLGVTKSVPSGLANAVDDLSMSKGILLFIVVLIGAVFIVVSTLGVLLTVYGRMFNLYLMIAISPLPIATAIGKPTRFVFFNFIKSFLSVVLEALVIVLVLFIFTKFAGTEPDINAYAEYVAPSEYAAAINQALPLILDEGTLDSDQMEMVEDILEEVRKDNPDGYVSPLTKPNVRILIPGSAKELLDTYNRYASMKDNLAANVFSYIAELAFLFLMLFGMLKGTDKLVHRIFGI